MDSNVMREPNDWRLTNQRAYLSGVELFWREYRPYRPDWDHDHCAFCFAKFAATAGDDIVNAGYTTADESHWICRQCFDDFHDMFAWRIAHTSEIP